MKWLTIDENYLNYLRGFESRIPLSDYGADKYKPFFGSLFGTDDVFYVTQVSHPKKKHFKMPSNMDFDKVYHHTGKLIAVINYNYMFPIPKYLYQELQYKNLENYRSFESMEEKSKYINLLKKELAAINSMNAEEKAVCLYNYKYEKPESIIAKRCIDFKHLEQLALQYIPAICP